MEDTRHTAEEMRAKYEEYEREAMARSKAAVSALQLVDPSKNASRAYSVYSKEKFRGYMKNPASSSKSLRGLSRFLYNRSIVYRRLVWYMATMIDTSARYVDPRIDITKSVNKKKVIKAFQETCRTLDNMNLRLELLKAYVTCWREDTFYGIAYYDETGYFILPLDPDYCKVSGSYMTGDLSYSVDMSYFKRHEDLVEWLGEPLTAMYKQYNSDTQGSRWIAMPDEYCVCLKANIDDYEIPLPPMMGLFNALINLADQEDVQAIADQQQIQKMLVGEMEVFDNNRPDDFKVNPETSNRYVALYQDALPEYATVAAFPFPVQLMSFGDDQAADVNRLANATKNTLNLAGGAQILDGTNISGQAALKAALTFDYKNASSALLPETQGYLNRFLSLQLTNPCHVEMLEVSPYNRDEKVKEYIEQAQYGFPGAAMKASILSGTSQLQAMSAAALENDILDITGKFKPLQSSHTQSSDNEGGGQEKDPDDLTDDGADSVDKRDANG